MSQEHKHIERLNLKRTLYESATNEELLAFNAGKDYIEFNDYIQQRTGGCAIYDRNHGMGVTHLIWDNFENGKRKIVAYFTLSTIAVPYDDGNFKTDEEKADLSKYPPINGAEIKMFAVDESYQDSFYLYQGEDKPVSAWCLSYIIDFISNLSEEIISIQAIFLHAIENAQDFYYTNKFSYAPTIMKPLYSADSDFPIMWMPLKPLPSVIQEQTEKKEPSE